MGGYYQLGSLPLGNLPRLSLDFLSTFSLAFSHSLSRSLVLSFSFSLALCCDSGTGTCVVVGLDVLGACESGPRYQPSQDV
jgi:hypothetical protein